MSLSPGDWHLKVPKDPAENLLFRRWLLDQCANKRRMEKVREACRHDILFYVNAFGWTFDTEAQEPILPLVTWPAQDRCLLTILRCAEERRDLVIEKARRQGGSWLSDLAQEYVWESQRGRQMLMISRQWEMVESKNPDSLFWKIDFFHKHLPAWLLPRGYGLGTRYRTKGYFENPETGCTITGQATTEKAGVGGRAYIMFVDEYSRIGPDREVFESTRDTCKCRIFNSTHTGPGTKFHELCAGGVMEKVILHWSESPLFNQGLYRFADGKLDVLDPDYYRARPTEYQFVKDGKPAGGPFPGLRSPWYDAECEARGSSRDIAMNLDIDALATMAQFFEPMLLKKLEQDFCCDPYWQGEIVYDPATCKPQTLVRQTDGALSLWCRLPVENKPAPGRYAIGGDIGTGKGATPSVLSIADCRTGDKVAEYATAFVDEKAFAKAAHALGWLFQDKHGEPAKLCWEQNGPGLTFGGEVLRLGYPRAYFRTAELPHTRKFAVSDTPGWYNRPEDLQALMEQYRSALATRRFLNRSKQAIAECACFRWKRGKLEHAMIDSSDDSGAREQHSDRVIADALCWKMIEASGDLVRKDKPKETQPTIFSIAGRAKWREDRERQEESA